MERVANHSWFPQTVQYKNTMAGYLPPLNVLLFPGSRERTLLYLPARTEKIGGERKRQEQKKVAAADLLPRIPISFLPGPFGPETPPQNTGTLLHYSVGASDRSSQWEGHATSPITTAA